MKSGRFSTIPSRAIDDKRLGNAAVCVLCALGTYGNRDGWLFVSAETVADRLGCSRQAVQQSIKKLVECGYLQVERRQRVNGSDSSSRYKILMDEEMPREFNRIPIGPHPVQDSLAPPLQDELAPPVQDELAPNLTKKKEEERTPPLPPSRGAKRSLQTKEIERDFEAFWQQYPNKVGKKAAFKAYTKAWKEAGSAEIIRGLERYIKTKPDWQHYCHPATWLNQGRWGDQIDAGATTEDGVDPSKLTGYAKQLYDKMVETGDVNAQV